MPQPHQHPGEPDRHVVLDDDQDRLDVPGWVASAILEVARGGRRDGGSAREAGGALAAAGAGDLASPGSTLASVLERFAAPVLDWRVSGLRGAGSGCLTTSGGVAALPYRDGTRVILGLHALEGLAAVFAFVAPVPDVGSGASPPPPLEVPRETFAEAIARGGPPPGLPAHLVGPVGQVVASLSDQWRLELVSGGAPAGARGRPSVEMLVVGPVIALLQEREAREELRATDPGSVRAAQRQLADRAVEMVQAGGMRGRAAPDDGRDRFGPDRGRAPAAPDAPTVVLGRGLPGEGADPTVEDEAAAPTRVLGGGLPGGTPEPPSPSATAPPADPGSGPDLPAPTEEAAPWEETAPPAADVSRPAPTAPAGAAAAAGPSLSKGDPVAAPAAPRPDAAATRPDAATTDDAPEPVPGIEREADGHAVRFSGEADGVLHALLEGEAGGALDAAGRLATVGAAHRAGLDRAARQVAARDGADVRWDVPDPALGRAWARELERLGHPVAVACPAAEETAPPAPTPSAAVVLWRGGRDADEAAAGARLLAVAAALRGPAGAEGLRVTEADGATRDVRPDAEALTELVRLAPSVADDARPPAAWDALGCHLVLELVGGGGAQPRARLTARLLVEPTEDRGDALVVDLAPDLAPDVAAASLAGLVEAFDADWACVETEATGWRRRTDPTRPGSLLGSGPPLDGRLHWRTWLGPSAVAAVDVDALRRTAAVDPDVRVHEVAGGTEIALGERWSTDDAVLARALRLEPAAFRRA